jgi:hypothetical protein
VIVAVTPAADPVADPGVVASGRSLTHPEARSLPSSAPPSARLTGFADARYSAVTSAVETAKLKTRPYETRKRWER